MTFLLNFLRPAERVPQTLTRLVYTTNVLSVLLSILTFVLLLILFRLFGWTSTSGYIMGVAVSFLLIVWANRWFYNTGRLLFCLMPILMTMFVTVYGKIIDSRQSYIIYFDARMILLGTVILPAAVFRLAERVQISLCFCFIFLSLAFFDPIHNAFGVGYFQRGFNAPSYYYINYIAITSFFILLFGIVTLKYQTERAEQASFAAIAQKEEVNRELAEKHRNLSNLNSEMEAQNEELQQQQEELSASQEKLQEANELINQQKNELADYNSHLERLVEEKSKSLSLSNQELVKHNNELRQFSYTVSHNMRGPLARLLGLTDLLQGHQTQPEELEKLLGYIRQSAKDLDTVLKDVSVIIDIRNQLFYIKERVYLQEEWGKVVGMLNSAGGTLQDFSVDFSQAPFAYVIRPMLHSILYNLATNAIKYRSPDRALQVQVVSQSGREDQTIIRVIDNGLGIDLRQHGDNLFKLYRRFHSHVSGKGIGLYIVKTQLELMAGSIDAESQLNVGSTFTITLPRPVEAGRQVFLENEAAQLFFDAELNTTVIVWKRKITSAEYRTVFDAILQTLRTYHSPGWIADLRKQGQVEVEDQIWFVNNVLPEAVRLGLKRIVTVGFRDPSRSVYYERMKAVTAELGIDLYACDTLEEARALVQTFLTRSM
ncbi:MAG: sensor histidine kinase [Bacteroidota bacterium]|nr:HAMP domain-containing sensor histidine kinase [Cytophagales bacterium]